MITTPETTIKLSDDQTAQLETYQLRLANLQNEISVHNKILSALKNDNARLAQEKEDTLKSVSKAITDLGEIQTKLAIAQETHGTLSASLVETQKDLATKVTANELKGMELKNKEDSLTKQEFDLNVKESIVNKKMAEHESYKTDFNNKVASLTEAIKTFNG